MGGFWARWARSGVRRPAYVTHVRQRLGCPVVLLAFCPDERTARIVSVPIETGHPEFVFRPRTYLPTTAPPTGCSLENPYPTSDNDIEIETPRKTANIPLT
ncbi:hypothetical protein [Nocardia jejuensis]|uniref:hypothetical protein n=1 Tax=Nocardia jejuensis TaxID=328049 RepID=UPI000A441F81|nr:hypothetical protein [Nocardia jejuensis]